MATKAEGIMNPVRNISDTGGHPVTEQPPQYGAPMQQMTNYGQPPPGYPGQPLCPPQQVPAYHLSQPMYGPPGQGPVQPYGQPYGQQGIPGQQMVHFMPRPEGIEGVPPGLEYLANIDQLLVHQQMELLEVLTGWETNNKYVIKNSVGQQVYYAAEESNLCMRQCCGPARGFTIHITDNFANEVIRVSRNFKCCVGCCWCACCNACAFEVTVEAPVGNVVGFVRQQCSFLRPKMTIFDSDHEPVLDVRGPLCPCQCICCMRDIPFQLLSVTNGDEVGGITKQWSGLLSELVTDKDNFGVKFPSDLDVRTKATCLGAVFLIDFMFFETKQNNHRRRY